MIAWTARRVDLDLAKPRIACGGHWSGFLPSVELGVDDEPVLEAVDAGGGGVAKADGAEVAGDLEMVRVRGVDGGGELRFGDDVVDLERGDAFGGPVVDEAAHAGDVRLVAGIARTSDVRLRCTGR